MTDPRAEIGELWWKVNRELHERFRQAFRDIDLPPMSMMVLKCAHKEPGVTVSEIARRAGVAKSHISKMVDQLCRMGYLEKRFDPDDQRVFRLYMTESAVGTMAEMEARSKAMWAEIAAAVPEEQVAEVAVGLRTLLAALNQSGTRQEEHSTSEGGKR